MVKPGLAGRPAMLEDPRVFQPAYLGPSGWIGIDLDDTGWDEVSELLDEFYRNTTGKRLIAELDAHGENE